MSATNACPECGIRVPPDAPLGLCPRCLMSGSSTETATCRPVEKGGTVAAHPPVVDWNEILQTVRELELVPAAEFEPLASVNGREVLQLDLREVAGRPSAKSSLNHRAGRVGFQAHTNTVRFRKIEIKDLSAPRVAATPEFRPLFNGKDLTGWVFGLGNPALFSVEDGAIVAHGPGDWRRMGTLLTDREYTNFLIRFQFQAPKDADSGVALRADPGDKAPPADVSIRTFDEVPSLMAVLNWSSSGSGSDALHPQQPPELRPPGSWNDMEVEVRGDRLRVSINSRDVLQADLAEVAARPRVYPCLKRPAGRIGLQAHTGIVRFRQIEIRDFNAPTQGRPQPR